MDLICCDSEANTKEVDNYRNYYSLPTMVGNWHNARGIEEAHMAILAYKKVHCQLLSSRTRAMLYKLLSPIKLGPFTGNLEYDKAYQLFSPSQPSHINSDYPYKNKGLFLSGMFDESNIDAGTDLMHGCLLTASAESMPCRRNTFFFRSDAVNAVNIYFGDDVFIEINSGTNTPLYVQAQNTTTNSLGKSMQLSLSQVKDVYTHFKIFHGNPKYRKDTIGLVITPSTNVIIQHVASGQNLAADASTWVTTFFGVECLASCRTYRNSNRIETAENMWQIVGHGEATKTPV